MGKKYLHFLLLFIVIIAVFVGGFLLGNKFQEEKEANSLIPPYYKPEDFVKPKNLPVKKSAEKKITIIMFHYVEYLKNLDDITLRRLDTSPDNVDKEFKALQENGYETYFVREIPDMISGKIVYPAKFVVLTFDDGYQDFYTVVYPLLKKYRFKATVYVIADYLGRNNFLTEKEIQEMATSGLVEIGSHTLDHLYLKLVPSQLARKQIFDSKTKLEEMLHQPIQTFAYPYGAFNLEVMNLVKEASYSAAVSVIYGSDQSEENLFYLSRIRSGFFTPQNIIPMLEKFSR